MTARRSGVLVPLFSLASTRSWGIGEFLDLPTFAHWLKAAGQSFVQILPITELPESETSPYSAITAMALDPIFISLPAVRDFRALGGEDGLDSDDREVLDAVRRVSRVDYRRVRALKNRCLRRAHGYFLTTSSRDSAHADAFAAFVREHSDWLDDYALFQALRGRFARKPWWEWAEPLARRKEDALARARVELRDEIEYRKYLQWIAAEQLEAAHRGAHPIQIFGDVPFMISGDSPDVWTRQREFRFDATVGVPPDAFSDTGQDWGLPPWRWEVMADTNFEWMRARAKRTAQLFDGFRLDHLVGLYRTYIRPTDKNVEPFFAPPDEPTQKRLGEQLVSIYAETGAEIIAEDLGTVPEFVRASLRRLGVPGYKVMRWERKWSEPGKPYIDPSAYEEASVATTGTHDTEPLVTWWESLSADEKRQVVAMPSVSRYVSGALSESDAVLRALMDAPSRLTILPIQDLFGWSDRINTPAQVSDENWTWMLPWRVDELMDIPESRDRARDLAAWTASPSASR